jgi:pantoate kinase
MGTSRKEAIRAAHIAEIKCSSGLGDVTTAARGGIEMRIGSGLEGEIRRIEGDGEVILAVIGEKVKTREILNNKKICEKISRVGKKCLEELRDDPVLENFFLLSKKFSKESGLMKKEVMNIVKAASRYGNVSHESLVTVWNSVHL